MTNPKPSRKRWKIALGVVVVFAAVGWLFAFPAYQRHRAIEEIERVGGEIERGSFGPQWLSQWGIKSSRVSRVFLEGTKVNDNTLAHLNCLANLQDLYLNDTAIPHDWRTPEDYLRIFIGGSHEQGY